jgi:4-hydroxythreonine-4-phosphate dehydrogenase
MTADYRPYIGVTMGDPAGIGPEITCKVFADRSIYDYSRPLVIGETNCLNEGMKGARIQLALNSIKDVSQAKFTPGMIDVVNLRNIDLRSLRMGEAQAMAGKASVEYIIESVKLALSGKIDAIVTGPINKLAMNMSGYKYPGHTELLADLTKSENYAMLLVAGSLKVIHVSTHVSLNEAIHRVKKERVLVVIDLADRALKALGIMQPRIAVAGLNPHAGEDGLFGNEEITEIRPAIEEAKRQGINASGPLPGDTVFVRARTGAYDVVVAMYHDQGHIPVKMMGFQSGVNVTIGLPIIRTSVDHGTAYDLVKKRLGTADPQSLGEALKLAAQMAKTQRAQPDAGVHSFS